MCAHTPIFFCPSPMKIIKLMDTVTIIMHILIICGHLWPLFLLGSHMYVCHYPNIFCLSVMKIHQKYHVGTVGNFIRVNIFSTWYIYKTHSAHFVVFVCINKGNIKCPAFQKGLFTAIFRSWTLVGECKISNYIDVFITFPQHAMAMATETDKDTQKVTEEYINEVLIELGPD